VKLIIESYPFLTATGRSEFHQRDWSESMPH